MVINWMTRMRGLGVLAVAGCLGWVGLGSVAAQGPSMGMQKGGMGMGGMGMHKGGMGMGGMGGCGMGMQKGGMSMSGMGGCGMGMQKGGMGMGGMGGCGMGMQKGGMGMGGMGMGGMGPPAAGMGPVQFARVQPGGLNTPGTQSSGAYVLTHNSQNLARPQNSGQDAYAIQRALQERAKAIQAQKDRNLVANGSKNP